MILLLDSSDKVCLLTLVDGDDIKNYSWQADRQLARFLLKFIKDKLAENGKNFQDISAIGVMRGAGSFTGLRIGITILNTLASELNIPIVGVSRSDNWHQIAIEKLKNKQNDRVVLPEYGALANTTKPKK